MSMSFADDFRTLQAIRDLRVLADLAPVEVRARIAAGIPDQRMAPSKAQEALAAVSEGREVDPTLHEEVLSALRLAAALPKDDFPTFLTATMVLLADTLERGEGYEEIHWYWQTFRGHYRVAAAVERAAIVQAIRRIGLLRAESDTLPETVPDLATAPAAALRPLIERFCPRGLAPPTATGVPGIAVLLFEALSSPAAANAAAEFWAEHAGRLVERAPSELLAGFRHLYETRDGWAPDCDVPIPLLDPPPGVDWPR